MLKFDSKERREIMADLRAKANERLAELDKWGRILNYRKWSWIGRNVRRLPHYQ